MGDDEYIRQSRYTRTTEVPRFGLDEQAARTAVARPVPGAKPQWNVWLYLRRSNHERSVRRWD